MKSSPLLAIISSGIVPALAAPPGGIWSSALSKIKGSVRCPGDRFKSDPYNSAAEPIWELVDGPHPEAVFHEYRMIPDYYWPEDDPSKAGEGANFIDNHVRAPPDFDHGSRSKLAGSTNADDEAAKGAAKSVNGLEHGGFSAPPDFDNGLGQILPVLRTQTTKWPRAPPNRLMDLSTEDSALRMIHNSFQSDVSGHTNADGGTAMGSDKSIDVDEHGGFSSPPHDEHVTNHQWRDRQTRGPTESIFGFGGEYITKAHSKSCSPQHHFGSVGKGPRLVDYVDIVIDETSE
ncbi:hypothetical protein PSTT_01948 [Puccinia striiformis]|uniref:Uncharacterized protein n=1 Tax=Puccinia striiformis TaxID=27350 RepID=A0A2S4W1J0_9BASI|nr:hypothetical protein PSTT_01948 [Puccinia striiformis]